jgi:biotin carboxylase
MSHLLIMDLPGGNDTDILQAAILGGHTFVFLTSDIEIYSAQKAVQHFLDKAQDVIDIPGFDGEEVQSRVLELHRSKPFDALLCLIDIRLIEAAQLAHKLGLRYLNPQSAMLLRDKFKVRERLAQFGVHQPEHLLATSGEELKAAVKILGLPVLIKPVDGYGSQNIIVLERPEDLEPWISPLERILPSHADYGLGVKANDRLMVERYMKGDFLGCDTFTLDGQHTLLGVNEKLMFASPSFAIKGGCFWPDDPRREVLEDYIFPILDAVGFDVGATHIELMMTQEGPQLIEINPRLVGAKIARLMGFSLNRSVHLDLINLHLGTWRPQMLEDPPHLAAVTRWLTVQEMGTLKRIDLPHTQDPRIKSVEILKKPGDAVSYPFENAHRIGFVMTAAQTRQDAERLAEQYIQDTNVTLVA